MLHLIWSIIVGFIVGVVARWIVPGAEHYGFLITAGIGIAGSLIGGVIGRMISKPPEGAAFHPAGFFLSIVGAVLLLFGLRFVMH
jgi:uncharacterized membrane protein YeaQ/YmgE (transglycosylase-associated protein family)